MPIKNVLQQQQQVLGSFSNTTGMISSSKRCTASMMSLTVSEIQEFEGNPIYSEFTAFKVDLFLEYGKNPPKS